MEILQLEHSFAPRVDLTDQWKGERPIGAHEHPGGGAGEIRLFPHRDRQDVAGLYRVLTGMGDAEHPEHRE